VYLRRNPLDDFVGLQRAKVSLDYRRVDSVAVPFDLFFCDGGWVSGKVQGETVGVVESGLNQMAGSWWGLSKKMGAVRRVLCFVFVDGWVYLYVFSDREDVGFLM
jgi:hypothetical protein